jgi:hypothetical protein
VGAGAATGIRATARAAAVAAISFLWKPIDPAGGVGSSSAIALRGPLLSVRLTINGRIGLGASSLNGYLELFALGGTT